MKNLFKAVGVLSFLTSSLIAQADPVGKFGCDSSRLLVEVEPARSAIQFRQSGRSLLFQSSGAATQTATRVIGISDSFQYVMDIAGNHSASITISSRATGQVVFRDSTLFCGN